MRTTLDLPDDILQRAEIAAVARGSSLRQLIIDALRHELEGEPQGPRRRLERAPIVLAPDTPLRTLSPDEIKQLDTEADVDAEVARARAIHR